MPVSLTAPNVANYIVGKGMVYFKPEGAGGDVDDYPVGNVPEFELTPTIEKLDHFSSMAGTRTKDLSIVLEKGLTVRMIFEEWNADNMAVMLIGTLDDSNPAAVTIDILSENSVKGHLRYVGTNDVGPKWTFDLPSVEFSPSGSLNPISDEFGGMEVTGEVLFADDTFGTASADLSAGSAVPTNTTPPSITGTPQVGQTLTAQKGVWTGSPHLYAYEWQTDDGGGYDPIPGATSRTYVVGALTGQPVRVKVTATNTIGPNAGTVVSMATPDILA